MQVTNNEFIDLLQEEILLHTNTLYNIPYTISRSSRK